MQPFKQNRQALISVALMMMGLACMYVGLEIHKAGGDRYWVIACFAGAIGLPVIALVLVVYQTTRNLRSLFGAAVALSERPAAGQCNVTALLLHDLFGGELLKTLLPEGRPLLRPY
jgi:hypothetical protein